MDAAAYRRLQHRMEARGRSATIQSPDRDCACAPSSPQSSPLPMSSNAQAWLLRRLQSEEVDITRGETDHRRRVPCCCKCCKGYHHLFHETAKTHETPNGTPPTHADAPPPQQRHEHPQQELSPPQQGLSFSHSHRNMLFAHPVSFVAQPYSTEPSFSQPESAPPMPSRPPAAPREAVQPSFSSSVMGRMLSSFLHRTDVVQTREPSVSVPEAPTPAAHLRASSIQRPFTPFPSTQSVAEEVLRAQRASITQLASIAAEHPHLSALSIALPRLSEQHQQLATLLASSMAEPAPPPPPPPPEAVESSPAEALVPLRAHSIAEGTTQPHMSTLLATSVNPPAPAEAQQTTPPAPVQEQQPHAEETEKASPQPPSYTEAVATATAAGTTEPPPPPPPLPILPPVTIPPPEASPPQQTQEGVTQQTQQVSPSMTAPPAAAPVVSAAVPVVPAAGLTTSGAANATTAVETGNVQTPVLATSNTEPTSIEVMNAMRERLLLEKADAYVRGLEQWRDGDDARCRNQNEILKLLTRLQQDDHEMLEALYESIASRDSDGPTVVNVEVEETPAKSETIIETLFPKEVLAVYEAASPHTTPPQTQQEQQSSQTPPAQTETTQNVPPLPVPPFSLVSSSPQQTEPSLAQVPSAGLGAQPRVAHAEVFPSDGGDGSMRSWVDKHFGATLDPQHRALLQHVLLSREAELRRATVAETHCVELESKLARAMSPVETGPTPISAATTPTRPSHLGMERLKPTSAINIHHTTTNTAPVMTSSTLYSVPPLSGGEGGERGVEGSTSGLHALQHDKETRLQLLTRASTESPSQPNPTNTTFGISGHTNSANKDEQEELRRWKLRCESVEQQQQSSARRVAELQGYVDQLRSGAQRAYFTALSPTNTPPVSLPTPFYPPHMETAGTTTVPLSSVGSSRPTCCPDAHGSPRSSVSTAPPPQTMPLASRGDRTAALQQLREELNVESARFAEETQRWRQYVWNQHQQQQQQQLQIQQQRAAHTQA